MEQISSREYRQALDVINERLNAGIREELGETGYSRYMELYDMGDGVTEGIRLGVNWSCCGTVAPRKTVVIAKGLQKTAKEAENFIYNGCEVVYGRSEPAVIEEMSQLLVYINELHRFRTGKWYNLYQNTVTADSRYAHRRCGYDVPVYNA